MDYKVKLLPFLMPNYIRYEVPTGKRQNGFKPEGNCVAVAELTEEQAKEYADFIREQFLLHWKRKTGR